MITNIFLISHDLLKAFPIIHHAQFLSKDGKAASDFWSLLGRMVKEIPWKATAIYRK